ncbi:UNVERIFIED_CONTAM: hypothetical protein FKN15_034739 [Acipenser sinensis]
MKKRKELDALIGIGGDSCKVCYPLCVFIVLVACVVACSGLIWMQIALKEDLDAMKETIRTMESSQKISSHEISKLSEDLLEKQKLLENMESGSKGLNKMWTNMTEINKQITLLDSAVSHLKANIKSASDLINLPTKVEELQKDVLHLHDAINELNASQVIYQTKNDQKISDINSTVHNITLRIFSLENYVFVSNVSRPPKHNDDHRVAELREKLLLINALTSKPDSEQLHEDSVHGDPESEHLSQENSKKTESKKIPIISEHSPKTNSEDFPKNPDSGKLERDTVKNSSNGEITKSEDPTASSDSAKQENEDAPKNSDNSKHLPQDNNKRPENMKSENLSKNFDLSKQESEDLPANSDNGSPPEITCKESQALCVLTGPVHKLW